MPKGGHRTGAGRPKGAKNKPKDAYQPALIPLDGAPPGPDAAPSTPTERDLTPLEYFLAVMNNPAEPAKRRDWAASMAAPYLHRRAMEEMPGKREQAQAAAEQEARGQYAPRRAPRLIVSNG
jgi:hypothetical protein